MIIGKFYQGEIIVSDKEKKLPLIDKKAAADRIKKLREDAHMTQEEMSNFLEKSLRSYQKVENGDNNISVSVLLGLKEKMGISADYILYGDKPDYATVWSSVQSCSEKDKMKILIQLVLYFTQKNTPQVFTQQLPSTESIGIGQMLLELLETEAK